jgi:transposase-like protein
VLWTSELLGFWASGLLGFWAAIRKVFPETREQRCWVHKTANVLNKEIL